MMEEHIITFPEQWITADKLEQALQQTSLSSFSNIAGIAFHFPASCRVMVDAAVRLLSLANQLIAEGIPVTMVFESEQNGTITYLNRANFFTLLSERVRVLPVRPDPTYAKRYQGQNRNLVEFASIGSRYSDHVESIPPRLANALEVALEARSDCTSLSRAAFTIFAELITNVYDHSQTVLDGFAALQVYPQGGRVQVVVSDSGIGLLETLRPKLLTPTAKRLADAELIRSLFCDDLTWNKKEKGMGLPQCAYVALKYKGSVGIRLETCGIHLKPSLRGYETNNIQYQQDLIMLKGTHICFSFPLDTLS
ncbi:MAG: ATP-binding protein [Chloroflexota bacterium]|nr:ATP-binding protein [Chloroflexota bacterium]